MTISAGQQALAADILKHATADGYLSLMASTTLTIASGAVTATANFYKIDTESAAASDDLDTITAGAGVDDGHLLVLRAANDARTVVIKHNTGNIFCENGIEQTLNDAGDVAVLIYDSNLTKWCALGLVGPSSVNTNELADGAVTTAKLAADSVDDTKAGNRVPQFYRRQGGNASNWYTNGTTTYTPTSVRMQGGSILVPDSSGSGPSFVDVTFPVAFSNVPLVYATVVTPGDTTEERGTIVSVGTPTASAVTIHCQRFDNVEFTGDSYVNWLAIGPE